nr:reverse transcriptase domain-containing protein [Tanacetum cinerariifolium]
MSSPDHSTSNNEDAFSSNIPDYISTIPDYSPASLGKKPILMLQSELPIPPPVILPPSLVLSQSPIYDSQYFFPSEEISPTDTETSELALLCLNMVPNSKKLIEVFIRGLPRSIKGNVTASKPQTLEEVITITQRLMEQVIKHQSAQEAGDHQQKFEDRRNTTGNNNNHSNNHNNKNFQDNRNNNNCNHNYQHKQDKRQEAIRAYAVNPTKDS